MIQSPVLQWTHLPLLTDPAIWSLDYSSSMYVPASRSFAPPCSLLVILPSQILTCFFSSPPSDLFSKSPDQIFRKIQSQYSPLTSLYFLHQSYHLLRFIIFIVCPQLEFKLLAGREFYLFYALLHPRGWNTTSLYMFTVSECIDWMKG